MALPTDSFSIATWAAMTLRLSPSVSARKASAPLGAGLAQDVLVGAVAADRLALELPRQAVERPRRGVDDDDLVAAVVECLGQRRADAAAADDHELHPASFRPPAATETWPASAGSARGRPRPRTVRA